MRTKQSGHRGHRDTEDRGQSGSRGHRDTETQGTEWTEDAGDTGTQGTQGTEWTQRTQRTQGTEWIQKHRDTEGTGDSGTGTQWAVPATAVPRGQYFFGETSPTL